MSRTPLEHINASCVVYKFFQKSTPPVCQFLDPWLGIIIIHVMAWLVIIHIAVAVKYYFEVLVKVKTSTRPKLHKIFSALHMLVVSTTASAQRIDAALINTCTMSTSMKRWVDASWTLIWCKTWVAFIIEKKVVRSAQPRKMCFSFHLI